MLTAGITWCPRCYEPTTAHVAPTPTIASTAGTATTSTAPVVGRWDATAITYGLSGRIIGTVLAGLPLLFLLFLAYKLRITAAYLLITAYMAIFRPVIRSLWRRSDRL